MKNSRRHSNEKQYNAFAERFQKADESFPDVTRPEIYKLVQSIFYKQAFDWKMHGGNPHKPRLLDLGCGYGKDLEYFSKGEIEVFGVDISLEMLKLARKRVPKAKLKLARFHNLPYPDKYFDLIFSRYAIQHTCDTDKSFREAHRVLKPRGELVFLVTHPMRHYFEKETKDYWVQEEIRSEILDGNLTVTEPSHTLTEYFSPFLLSKFTLEVFEEKEDPAAKRFEGLERYPRILIAKYRKK